MNTEDIQRCHCNNCGRDTDHWLVESRVVEDAEAVNDVAHFWWADTYAMLQCRGCGSVCLRHLYEDAEGEKALTYYPPPISRRAPLWRWKLPDATTELLNEIYVALHNDSRRLALMGTRTLVDMLLLQEVGDAGTFDARLKALREKGVVSEKNREVLSVALDAGSAAAHRGYKPGREEIEAVLDIVENILQATHHLSQLAEDLRKKIPTRPANK
jgi:Domain of unknown function (DUF4145)